MISVDPLIIAFASFILGILAGPMFWATIQYLFKEPTPPKTDKSTYKDALHGFIRAKRKLKEVKKSIGMEEPEG